MSDENEGGEGPDDTKAGKRVGLLAKEPALLDELLIADDAELEELPTQLIEVMRRGRVYLRFRVQSLDPKTYQACGTRSTRAANKGNLAAVLGGQMNLAERNARLVVEATVPEHRRKVWDPERAAVVHEWEVVLHPKKGLSAGELAAVVGKIDELCGFRIEDEREAEELVGN